MDTAGHFLQNPFYRSAPELLKKYPRRPYVFTFVRNPWDRVVSAFFYLNQGGGNLCDKWDRHQYLRAFRGNFARFVRSSFPAGRILRQMHFRPQHQWVSDGSGQLITDFVGKYERLEQDLRELSGRLDIRFNNPPLINESEHDHYREYYDEVTKDIVADAYRKDIELFDYRF